MTFNDVAGVEEAKEEVEEVVEFLTAVDDGEVVKVEIQGNNIKGVLSNGNSFSTYSPNDPNLIEKLSNKGVSISAAPLEEKMPSLFGVLPVSYTHLTLPTILLV